MNHHKKKIFNIIKASGTPEKFSKKKLYTSLKHAGVTPKTCQNITDQICKEMNEGFRTRDIYRRALGLLDERSHVAAVHYSLKRALFDLGPSGYYFEEFVARYFEELGYQTKTGQTIQGKLVKHEVDVVGSKAGKKIFVECKFHNRFGIKNDIKTALYVKARWDDLREGPEGKNLGGFFLASNTAFSLDAITYAEGSGLQLLGVNAPPERSFLDHIKNLRLYPITSLKRLNRSMKHQLLAHGIILAKDLVNRHDLFLKFGWQERDIDVLMNEVDLLIK